MRQEVTLAHQFVEFIPEELDERTLYISTRFKTAAHNCCCGCGMRVVTPLTPTDWKLDFDGKTVSLYPSIGNWSFPCRSHYWIKRSRVEWAVQWSQAQIERGRAYDRKAKGRFFDTAGAAAETTKPAIEPSAADMPQLTWWQRLVRWCNGS